jgi:hypothetical protein
MSKRRVSRGSRSETSTRPSAVAGALDQGHTGRLETLTVAFAGRRRVGDEGAVGMVGDDAARRGRPEQGVEDDAAQVFRRVHAKPARQSWVVCQHRADPDQDGIVLLTQFQAPPAGWFAGDPLRVAVAGGDAPVEGDGCLLGDPRASVGHAAEPSPVEPTCLVLQMPDLDIDAGRLDAVGAPAGGGVGIGHGDHHSGHTGVHHRLAAGRGSSVVIAGLQRDPQRASASAGAGLGETRDLGVGAAAAGMPAATHHSSRCIGHDGTDHGIG